MDESLSTQYLPQYLPTVTPELNRLYRQTVVKLIIALQDVSAGRSMAKSLDKAKEAWGDLEGMMYQTEAD